MIGSFGLSLWDLDIQTYPNICCRSIGSTISSLMIKRRRYCWESGMRPSRTEIMSMANSSPLFYTYLAKKWEWLGRLKMYEIGTSIFPPVLIYCGTCFPTGKVFIKVDYHAKVERQQSLFVDWVFDLFAATPPKIVVVCKKRGWNSIDGDLHCSATNTNTVSSSVQR